MSVTPAKGTLRSQAGETHVWSVIFLLYVTTFPPLKLTKLLKKCSTAFSLVRRRLEDCWGDVAMWPRNDPCEDQQRSGTGCIRGGTAKSDWLDQIKWQKSFFFSPCRLCWLDIRFFFFDGSWFQLQILIKSINKWNGKLLIGKSNALWVYYL